MQRACTCSLVPRLPLVLSHLQKSTAVRRRDKTKGEPGNEANVHVRFENDEISLHSPTVTCRLILKQVVGSH